MAGPAIVITAEDLENRFTYHAPDEVDAVHYQSIRERAHELATFLVATCPPGRDLSTAVTKLEEAVFWANASIARADDRP